jgi:hypothetical protein
MIEDITDEQHFITLQQDGYRRLAAAVIYQALMDRQRGPSDKRYQSAQDFLVHSDMRPWIDAVEIDREAFMNRLPDIKVGSFKRL